jgi:hypothetical protein
VRFAQLNWLRDDGSTLVPFSRVGDVEFTFSRADVRLLERNHGGYVNLATDAGTGLRWSVENLYLSYPDTDYMRASHPHVEFDLGVANGTRVDAVSWSIAVTADPLAAPPQPARHALVVHEDYLVGGLDGGGSGEASTPDTIGPFVGCHAADCVKPVFVAFTPAPSTRAFDTVAEGKMGCAPGAVARSLRYMFGKSQLKDVTAQDIYADLYKRMSTSPTDGTSTPALESGKRSYVKDKKLPATSQMYSFKNGTRFAPPVLTGGGDVELRIQWTQGAAHFAIVSSITPLGKGKGFEIKYVDDPDQNDGTAQNQEHTIETDSDGNIVSGGSGKVTNFLVETKTGP